jgi:acyl carrier protein
VAWLCERLAALDLAASPDALTETTGLFGQGIGLDSIEVLQLVTGIEEEFDLTFDDEDLAPERFRTVGTVAAFIEEKLA